MNAEPSGTSEYVFISLNMPAFIHTHAQKQWCKLKQPLNCERCGSVGSATDFNTKGPEFDPALGRATFSKPFLS